MTDRYLRYTPAWKGTEAVLSSTPASSPGPQLKIPRGDLLRVEWDRTMVFLKNLKIETSNGELFLLAGRDTLEQLSAALGGAR